MLSHLGWSKAPLHLSFWMQLLHPTRQSALTLSPTFPAAPHATRTSGVQVASSGTSLQRPVEVVDVAEDVVVDAVDVDVVTDVRVVVVVPVVVLLVHVPHRTGQFFCMSSATAGCTQRSCVSIAHSGSSGKPLQCSVVVTVVVVPVVLVDVVAVDVVVVVVTVAVVAVAVVEVAVTVVFVAVTVVVEVSVAVVVVVEVLDSVTVVVVVLELDVLVVVVVVSVFVDVTVVAVVVGRCASETSTSAGVAPSSGNTVKLNATVMPFCNSERAATIPLDRTSSDVTGVNVVTLVLDARPYSLPDVITLRRASTSAESTGKLWSLSNEALS